MKEFRLDKCSDYLTSAGSIHVQEKKIVRNLLTTIPLRGILRSSFAYDKSKEVLYGTPLATKP